VSALLPAGSAVATGYTYRRLARRGAGSATAVWVLIASGVVSTAALVGLGLAGAELYGIGLSRSAVGLIASVVIAGVPPGAVGLLAWTSRRGSRLDTIGALIERVGQWGWHPIHRRSLSGRDRTGLVVPGGSHPITMGTVRWMGVCTVAAANWVADWAVLGMSFLALGFGVPWKGLLLAYTVSQVAASLPLLGCICRGLKAFTRSWFDPGPFLKVLASNCGMSTTG
jgi:uncharacterized membrane protein YbhN (UPF0104 family)